MALVLVLVTFMVFIEALAMGVLLAATLAIAVFMAVALAMGFFLASTLAIVVDMAVALGIVGQVLVRNGNTNWPWNLLGENGYTTKKNHMNLPWHGCC